MSLGRYLRSSEHRQASQSSLTASTPFKIGPLNPHSCIRICDAGKTRSPCSLVICAATSTGINTTSHSRTVTHDSKLRMSCHSNCMRLNTFLTTLNRISEYAAVSQAFGETIKFMTTLVTWYISLALGYTRFKQTGLTFISQSLTMYWWKAISI